jgi:hypothetical protein
MFMRTNTDKFFTPICMLTQNEIQAITIPEATWYCMRISFANLHKLVSLS